MIYLGIDPGKTTGITWCSQRDNQFVIHDFANLAWPDFMNWTRTWDTKFYDLSGLSDEKVIVVCEDFILRKSAGWTPTPVDKQIGVLYKAAFDLGWHFALQQPMVKPAGYRIGKIPNPPTHWKDALAHVYYAKTQGLDPVQRIIW